MSTRPYIIHVYGGILSRRTSMTACSFASHFGQEMAQNADLPISCKNLSGVIPPNPRTVLGHRVVLFPDSRYFGSHNFQIVPARLLLANYRAMHFSAKRGIAIACRLSVRLSVRPSVTLVNCDHICWNSSKIISPLVSLGCSLFATPT